MLHYRRIRLSKQEIGICELCFIGKKYTEVRNTVYTRITVATV